MSDTQHAAMLTTAFESLLTNNYSHAIPPEPYITPTGIRHLDAIMGGGFSSSLPSMISAVPESGKSTMALSFASQFLRQDSESLCAYIDTEGSGSGGKGSLMNDRLEVFGIDQSRFIVKSVMLNVPDLFKLFGELIKLKRTVEEKVEHEIKLLIILDSLASVPSSKEIEADSPNAVIGLKARELTHHLSGLKVELAMSKVTMLIIDQVRASIAITNQYQAQPEKSVGSWSDFKAATNVNSLAHNLKSWIYLSKGKNMLPSEPLGVDGHILNVLVEKSKLAPSGSSVAIVFDKKFGVIPVLSEYLFLLEMTKTEKKLTKNVVGKLTYPLAISTSGKSKIISVIDPDTGEILKQSQKFTERKFMENYNSDPEFKQIFDEALAASIEGRIFRGIFRTITTNADGETQVNYDDDSTDDLVDDETNATVGVDGELTASL